MSTNLPARFGADRATGKALSTIQLGAFVERAEDEAQLALAIAKMHFIRIAADHAFEDAEGMVNDFRRRAGDDLLTAQALAPILEGSLRDLDRVRGRLGEAL